MSYRIGTCSSCGASFKVPASFAADRARCKTCSGVVEIGEVTWGEGSRGHVAAHSVTRVEIGV